MPRGCRPRRSGKERTTMRMRTGGWPARMRRAALARRAPRGAVRVVAVALVIVAAGVSVGSAAAGQQSVSLRLGYTCAFPSASWPVTTLVTATFPASGTAGQPVQPTGTGIAVTLPQAAVTDLARRNSAAMTLTARLNTKVTEGPRQSTVIWRGLSAPATAITRGGPLTLTTSGAAPPVTAAAGAV